MTDARDADAPAADPGLGIPSWILLLVFSVVPVVFATGFSQFGVLKNAVLVVGVGAALAVWAVAGLARGKFSVAAGRVLILAGIAALYVAVSVVWSPGVLYGTVAASSVVALLGIVVLVAAPVGRPIRFIEFAMAVSVGMGAVALTGVLDLAGLGVFTVVWDPPGFTGAFDAMEFAVAFYAVSLPIAVAGTQYSAGPYRLGFGVASVLGAVHFGLVANWTYLGLFAAACVIVALLIVAFEGLETVVVLSPIATMVGLVVLINFVAGNFLAGPSEPTDATSLPILERERGVEKEALEDKAIRNAAFAIDRMETVRSMDTHAYLAKVAFDLVQDRPIFGHGAGAWWRLQTKHPNADDPAVRKRFLQYPAFRSPHDLYSKLLVEYGPVGFALLALWLIGCLTIGFRALGQSGETPDLVAEQWGLWGATVGGLLIGAMTPLIELAPAAAVWFGSIALLTRRSAEVNAYGGSSERWTLGGDAGPKSLRAGIGVLAFGLAGVMVVVTVMDTVSRLYRGWGDHLMLRTYYERAITQYETADEWMPIHGGVVYNISLAESRLGVLGESSGGGGTAATSDGTDSGTRSEGAEAGGKSPGSGPDTEQGTAAAPPDGTSVADAGTPPESFGDEARADTSSGRADGNREIERRRVGSRKEKIRRRRRCRRRLEFSIRPEKHGSIEPSRCVPTIRVC
jgi:hypothetical protein